MSNKNKNTLVADMLKKSMANLIEVADESNTTIESDEIAPKEQIKVIVEGQIISKVEEANNIQKYNDSINQNGENDGDINNSPKLKSKKFKMKKKTQPPSSPQAEETTNIVITYNNPMQNLITSYSAIIKLVTDEEADILSGFKKRPAQSKTHCNATIQVRRDIYEVINEYILDSRLGKTKVLNEIFMLGANEFINKYSKKNKTPN